MNITLAEEHRMIEARIRKQGNSFVVTIPRDEMERYHLTEGDEIAFAPTRIEKSYVLSPELAALVDQVIEEDREALEYLADR
jgi:putative addiction module antidote